MEDVGARKLPYLAEGGAGRQNERPESIRDGASERSVVDGDNSVRAAIIEFQYRLSAYSAITIVI
jgi:hypothetical protein